MGDVDGGTQEHVVYKFDTASSEGSSYTVTEQKKKTKICYGLLFLIVLAALATITAGIVLLNSTNNKIEKITVPIHSTIKDLQEYCDASDEARRIGLNHFLQKCQDFYFQIFPHEELLYHEESSQTIKNNIAKRFKPFVPSPKNLKNFADQIQNLLDEANSFKVDENKMKPKENQILAEIKVFLNQFMSNEFDGDFYGGGWMFGPNYFCFHRICRLSIEINTLTFYYRPKSVEDIEFLMETFIAYNKIFVQYTKNLKAGIKSGMVRSKSSCEAGEKAFKDAYIELITSGTSKAWFVRNLLSKEFYKEITDKVRKQWQKKHKQKILHSIYSALVHGFSKPALNYYKYLVNEYSKHCPPDRVASGLSSLPLKYEYLNGNPDFNKPTTKRLPLTNTPLDGKILYGKILPRFTTLDISVDDIYQEGMNQLKTFYPKIVEIAKRFSKLENETEAIIKLRQRIKAKDQWHGSLKFPEIESNGTAYVRCIDDKSAKKYCPTRWRSMEKWKNYLNRVLSMIHPRLNDIFYFTGDKTSVPNCPIAMTPHYNPSIGAMYYEHSDANCKRPTQFGLPFFLEKYGPKFQEWSITGHEARPGHNFQHQGSVELFASPCKNSLQSFFHKKGILTGFIEGWALYAENPVLSDDVKLYENNLLQKLGMYKWQIWRAARLVIDTGLHYRGKNRDWALNLLNKYALEETDLGRKEITRYMSTPGQAAAYMIGRLEIIKARKKLEKELGTSFNLKEFHYQILSLGQVPLGYLSKYMDRYINCLKHPTERFCEYLTTPVRSIPHGNMRQKKIQYKHTSIETHAARYYI